MRKLRSLIKCVFNVHHMLLHGFLGMPMIYIYNICMYVPIIRILKTFKNVKCVESDINFCVHWTSYTLKGR